MAEYIERDRLLICLAEEFDKHNPDDVTGSNIRHGISLAGNIIRSLPTTKVAEVKHGKWDRNHNCSVCGVYKFKELDADVWADWNIDYCPHCGAKMDLEV